MTGSMLLLGVRDETCKRKKKLMSKASRETILLVDGTPSVLLDVSLIIRNLGFTVLSASTSEEALQISLDFDGLIDLLITEVMMPGMSGPDLAKQLMVQRRKLRVIMITAYASGEMLILNYGWHLVSKASVAKTLGEKVKTVLYTPDRSQGTDEFDTRREHAE
jgi:two-component system cell cycle sensor histidine kinase/response regulator CckA